GNTQIGRYAAGGLGLIRDALAGVLAAIDFLFDLHVERAALFAILTRELPHHPFHATDNLGPTLQPVVRGFHPKLLAFVAAVDEEIIAREARLGSGRAGGDEEEQSEHECFHGWLSGCRLRAAE